MIMFDFLNLVDLLFRSLKLYVFNHKNHLPRTKKKFVSLLFIIRVIIINNQFIYKPKNK